MILTAINGHLPECPNYGENLCNLHQEEEIFIYIYTGNVSIYIQIIFETKTLRTD